MEQVAWNQTGERVQDQHVGQADEKRPLPADPIRQRPHDEGAHHHAQHEHGHGERPQPSPIAHQVPLRHDRALIRHVERDLLAVIHGVGRTLAVVGRVLIPGLAEELELEGDEGVEHHVPGAVAVEEAKDGGVTALATTELTDLGEDQVDVQSHLGRTERIQFSSQITVR